MTEAMVAALRDYDASSDFTRREKCALQFAERMAVDHYAIDDAFFDSLKEAFSPAEIIELGMLIGIFIGYGRLLAVLNLEQPEVPPTYQPQEVLPSWASDVDD